MGFVNEALFNTSIRSNNFINCKYKIMVNLSKSYSLRSLLFETQ